ncbi:MAG: hypothetical protein KIH01_05695 [Candidatus Freyarchaeota archaeon]|nr:hypothetical protein [Candidatus Jordarchaeia archaeon]
MESVPFERVERAARIGLKVFDGNVLVYQKTFFDLFKSMGGEGHHELPAFP